MKLPAILFLLALLAATATVAAQATAPGPGAGPGDKVEELGQVEVIAAASPDGKPAGLGDLLGRLHPALVHFPLAWLFGLLVIDCVGLGLGRQEWRRWGFFALVGTALAFLPAAVTGLLREDYMPSDADVARNLTIHRTLNFIVFGLVLAALGLRWFRRNDLQGWSRRAYLALVVVATLLVLLAANFGGKMVYGSHFLPF
jgi:uncharacterized membrane protein